MSTPERQGELAQTLLQAFENAMREVTNNYSQYITLKIENGGQYNA
ncbi:hypothetical protein N568_0111950 [Lactococcus garvieae TRF1]|uniref:Uncharacterized protein n=1 Tax=Lactococcus garvieae TRF1 TaxID=1380772 RepID=V8ANG0_9LACT|nr:hypothetical protein N568_0111950 [Lactococcus garvieae TRF1]